MPFAAPDQRLIRADAVYGAANFTVLTTGGTWTVTASNVKTLKYQVVHTTMTVAFEIIQASVSGSCRREASFALWRPGSLVDDNGLTRAA
jgi:hypothetical protein